MHKWLLAAALLLLVAPASAQPSEYSFEGDAHARLAFGDIPLTEPVEADGLWHMADYVRFSHDGTNSVVTFPVHGELESVFCDCGNVTVAGDQATIGSDIAAGDHVLRVTSRLGNGAILVNNVGSDLVVYLPADRHVDTDGTLKMDGLPCTTGGCTIYTYGPSSYFGVFPGDASVVAQPADKDGVIGEWAPAILGILVGIALWSYLVSKGMVQKRRKQEVTKAAHVEAAATESQDTLAARKRVLMAGLKELEKAKMGKEIDTDVYDALKAELKKETVIVMRALESAP